MAGAGGELVYKTLTGLKADLTVESKPVLLRDETGDTKGYDENERKYKCSIIVHNAHIQFIWTISIFTESSDDGGSDGGSNSDSSDDGTSAFKRSARPRDESPESKKLRKKAVRDAQADKRKSKLKKHVKKRKDKQGTKKK